MKISFLILLMSLFSCIHKIEAPNSPQYCYSNDIAPILSANCMMEGCHGSSGHGDINLSSYPGVMNLVSSGDPKGSELYNVVSSTWGTFMPPKPYEPLTETQRTTIYLWILQGANTECIDTNNTRPIFVKDSVSFQDVVLPLFISYCAGGPELSCHNINSHYGEYTFTDYQNIVSKGILPGNATESFVFKILNGAGSAPMPPLPYNPMGQAQKDSIFKWINEGAKNTYTIENCDTTHFTFTPTISKIIQWSCTPCHSGINPAYGLRIGSYADIKPIATSGLLLWVINNTNNKPLMPPYPLSECQKTQIKKWVIAGALDN